MKRTFHWGILLVAVLLIAGIVLMITLFGINRYNKGELVSFNYSCGGDMNGSSYTLNLRQDPSGSILMTTAEAAYYYEDPEVEEYYLDPEVLKEIKTIFQKNHMEKWNGENLSEFVVDDGETITYSFEFEEDSVYFSAQVFPSKISEKVKQIDDMIEQYKTSGTPLGKLILPELTDEERWALCYPEDGRISMRVYKYAMNRVYARISNGTDAVEVIRGHASLWDENGNSISLAEESLEEQVNEEIGANQSTDFNLELPERLSPGVYELRLEREEGTVSDSEESILLCTFEIGCTS